jgi:hypothetical protein
MADLPDRAEDFGPFLDDLQFTNEPAQYRHGRRIPAAAPICSPKNRLDGAEPLARLREARTVQEPPGLRNERLPRPHAAPG